jgi:4a-hydroxytetrahydrobiopterin dehydratase
MSELAAMVCTACRGEEPPLTRAEIDEYRKELPDWALDPVDGVDQLVRVFRFRNFAEALEFTNRVGSLAEQQGHHPAILTEWGRVTLRWWTHKIEGLHRNDFIMAGKSDQAYRGMKGAAP